MTQTNPRGAALYILQPGVTAENYNHGMRGLSVVPCQPNHSPHNGVPARTVKEHQMTDRMLALLGRFVDCPGFCTVCAVLLSWARSLGLVPCQPIASTTSTRAVQHCRPAAGPTTPSATAYSTWQHASCATLKWTRSTCCTNKCGWCSRSLGVVCRINQSTARATRYGGWLCPVLHATAGTYAITF